MRERIKNKKVKAAFTLEAAVIVPIVMVMIVSLLFLALTIHDCVVMSTVSSYIMMENATKYPEQPEMVEDEILQMLSSRMIISKNIEVAEEKDGDKISVRGMGKINIPLAMVRNLTGISGIETSIDISNLNGRKTLLKYKAICDGFRNVSEQSKNGEDRV